ncbi:MAG: hypothetical protein R3D25_04575 [Geminicoccaceae bacterium]
MPAAMASPGTRGNGAARHDDPPARRPGEAEDALHGLGATGADEAVEAEDLAPAELEGDIGELGGVAEAFDLEHHLADRDIALGEDLVDRPADHEADELGLGHLGRPALADLPAIAQADPAVGDAKDLVELVADEEDRPALRPELVDEGEELADLVPESEAVGSSMMITAARATGHGRSRPCASRHGEPLQRGLGGEIRVDAGEQLFGPVADGRPVDQPAARHVAHEDVLLDRQLVEHHRLLMDGGDAGGPGVTGWRSGGPSRPPARCRHRACRCRSGS